MKENKNNVVSILFVVLFSLGFCLVQDLNFYFGYRDYSSRRFAYSLLVSEDIYADIDDIDTLNERSYFSETTKQDLLRLGSRDGNTTLFDGEAGVNRIYSACVYVCFTGFFLLLLLTKQKAFSLIWLLPWLLLLTGFSGSVFHVYSISVLYLAVALFFFTVSFLKSGRGEKLADLLNVPGAILTVGFAFFMLAYFLIKKPDPAYLFKDKVVGDYALLLIVAGVHTAGLLRSVKECRAPETANDTQKKKRLQSISVQYGVALALTVEILIYLALNGYSYFARVFVNLFAVGYFVLLQQSPGVHPFEAFAERLLRTEARAPEPVPAPKTKRRAKQ